MESYKMITAIKMAEKNGKKIEGIEGDVFKKPLYELPVNILEALYEQAEPFTEVRCDYYDEMQDRWCIDAWRTDDENAEGEVVGWVDGTSGNIYYRTEEAECSQRVCKAAEERQTYVRNMQKKLKAELGETIAIISGDLFREIYPKMKICDSGELALKLRDLAYEFEKNWDRDDQDRDYLLEVWKFEEEQIPKLKDLYWEDGWREEEILDAANWLDLDKCERAYELGGVKKCWIDYTIEGYNDLSEEEQERLSNEGKAWDDVKFYAEFKEWWLALDTDKRKEIYEKL